MALLRGNLEKREGNLEKEGKHDMKGERIGIVVLVFTVGRCCFCFAAGGAIAMHGCSKFIIAAALLTCNSIHLD